MARLTRDWLKVGGTSSRDYYTFEWAPALADEHVNESLMCEKEEEVKINHEKTFREVIAEFFAVSY